MITRFILACITSGIFLLPGSACAGAAGFTGRLELRLDGALAQFRDGKFGNPVHLDLYAECDDGRWHDVWAESDKFNRAIHLGEVMEAIVTPENFRLKVKLTITSDPWIKGGPGNYELDLKRGRTIPCVDWHLPGWLRKPWRAIYKSGHCNRSGVACGICQEGLCASSTR